MELAGIMVMLFAAGVGLQAAIRLSDKRHSRAIEVVEPDGVALAAFGSMEIAAVSMEIAKVDQGIVGEWRGIRFGADAFGYWVHWPDAHHFDGRSTHVATRGRLARLVLEG